MAIVLRWLYVANSSSNHRRSQQLTSAHHAGPETRPPGMLSGPQCSAFILIVVYFVLTFTHELSPYILAVQIGALGVAGLIRPRWTGLILAAIALGYLLPRFPYVNSKYGLVNSFGNFFGNVAPPKFPVAVAASQRVLARCGELLSIGVWAFAMVGAWMRRRSGRVILALVLLAFTPIILLAAEAYGQEGILRVYLFSLPWTAALAALAREKTRGQSPRRSDRRRRPASARAVGSWISVALFLPAFFGSDRFVVMTKSEVAVVTSFLEHARGGVIYCANSDAPLEDTARYNIFSLKSIFGNYGLLGKAPVNHHIADVIAAQARFYNYGKGPVYVMITPSMVAYNQAYRVTSTQSLPILRTSLADSHLWKLIVDREGTIIYQLKQATIRT